MVSGRFSAFVAAVCVAALAACSGAESPGNAPDSASGTPTSPAPLGTTGPVPTAAADAPGATACAPGPGRVVEELPDVTVAAVEVPPVLLPDGTVALAGYTLPAQVVDAGCVIRFDAPGGCLGAVEITAATIPAATIPRSALPTQRLSDDRELAAVELAEVTAAAVTAPAVRTEQVCQVELDGELPTVSRAGVVRTGVSRSGVARPGGTRPGGCDGDRCAPEVSVPAVRLEPVRLPDVDVAPGRLESRDLTRDVEVLSGEGEVSYVAPAQVLFDTEQAVIRPQAAAALAEIAAAIQARSPGARLYVDGHTDDRGDEGYGQRLSEQRAAAVAAWLTSDGGIDAALITPRGFGESAPVVPNTSDANRQLNRRVVITVRAG